MMVASGRNRFKALLHSHPLKRSKEYIHVEYTGPNCSNRKKAIRETGRSTETRMGVDLVISLQSIEHCETFGFCLLNVSDCFSWSNGRIVFPSDEFVQFGQVHTHTDSVCVFFWYDHNWSTPSFFLSFLLSFFISFFLSFFLSFLLSFFLSSFLHSC